jgi:two-component system nitrogen regulation response regulator GlnG
MAPAQTIEIKDLPPDLVSTQQTPVDAASAVATVAGGVADIAAINGVGSNGAALPVGGVVLATGVAAAVQQAASAWEGGLRTEVARLLRENSPDVMDELSRRFEAAVIREALDFTRGRKVEAAERLGIGRNTITRKIQELNLEP